MKGFIKFCLSTVRILIFFRRNKYLDFIIYQGIPVYELASLRGLLIFMKAYFKKHYNNVALNHGIKRLVLNDYSGEVIWGTFFKSPPVTFMDGTIQLTQSYYPKILPELRLLCEVSRLKKFPDSDNLTGQGERWSYVDILRAFLDNPAEFQKNYLNISDLFGKLNINSEFGFCFLSVLSGNSVIALHRGSSSLRYRYHLGVDIPEPQKCHIQIDDKKVYWENGVAFGFDDSSPHMVVNASEFPRAVLVFDRYPTSIPQEVIEIIRANRYIFSLGIVEHTATFSFKLSD